MRASGVAPGYGGVGSRTKRVPARATLGCDWPYAVRRYNGGGVNSYHYQYEVLQRLVRPPLDD